jgi:hypothetical protein
MAMVGALTIWPPSGVFSCGYHDDVTLARGVLNWVYPDALHVIGAIATAVGEKRLPAPNASPVAFGPRGYHSAARSLDKIARQLNASPGETPPLSFSLILIEPMLWTRFSSGGDGLEAHIHVPGPQAGDLVVISGEDVIREVASNRLSFGEAYRLGLVRTYGTGAQIAAFLGRYDRIGSAQVNPADLN